MGTEIFKVERQAPFVQWEIINRFGKIRLWTVLNSNTVLENFVILIPKHLTVSLRYVVEQLSRGSGKTWQSYFSMKIWKKTKFTIPNYIIILQFRCKYEFHLRLGHKTDHKYQMHLLGKKGRVMAVVNNVWAHDDSLIL